MEHFESQHVLVKDAWILQSVSHEKWYQSKVRMTDSISNIPFLRYCEAKNSAVAMTASKDCKVLFRVACMCNFEL